MLLDAVGTTLFGGTIGLAVALSISGILDALVFEVPPLDPVTVVGVCALLAAVNVLAAYGPVRQATWADPLVALRAD